jgi:hypothetical protein
MPVVRISPIRVLKGHQPGSWHGTQNRRTSFNYKAYETAGIVAGAGAISHPAGNGGICSRLGRSLRC